MYYQKIIIKRSTILYLFIDDLINLVHSRLIINRKGPKRFFSKNFGIAILNIYIYIFHYFFVPILGLTLFKAPKSSTFSLHAA
jgi:hypothetical protein